MTTDLNELYKMKRRGGGTSVDLTDLPGYQQGRRDNSPGIMSADLADLPGYRRQATAPARPRLPKRKTKTKTPRRLRTVAVREAPMTGGGVSSPGLGSGAEIPEGGLIGQGMGVYRALKGGGKKTGMARPPKLKSAKALKAAQEEATRTERFERKYEMDEYGRVRKKPKGVVGKLKRRFGWG